MEIGSPCLFVLCLLALFPAAGSVSAWQTTLPPAVPLEPVGAILEAFKTHQVVTLPGAHDGDQLHALLMKLIHDPRFPAAINDIVGTRFSIWAKSPPPRRCHRRSAPTLTM